jgi:SNF2 family DNA or RNA helicase
MDIIIYSNENTIIFKSKNENSKVEIVNLRISIGLNLIKDIKDNYFTITHVDYLNNFEFINNIIKINLFEIDNSFREFISNISSDSKITHENMNGEEFSQIIKEFGFNRVLKDFQIRNVLGLIKHKYGATFSVPGAGKTSEILSIFSFYKSKESNLKLFVVCPKNAFSSWDEQIMTVFNEDVKINSNIKDLNGNLLNNKMCRLSKGYDNIKYLLDQNPDFLIISYQQISIDKRVTDLLIDFISKKNVFFSIDESHRIKRNDGKVSNAILEFSTISKYRYIMSGTPMPQGTSDLINQTKFLIPYKNLNEKNVIDEIQQIYVRTTKLDLNILPLESKYIKVEMSKKQRELYDKIKFHEKRKFETSRNQLKLKEVKRSIMRMLQISSNPRIINDPSFIELVKDQDLNGLFEEFSPKFIMACDLTKSLIQKGEKVIIWSGFQKNIDLLYDALIEFNPVVVDGRTPSSENDELYETREFNINKFKTDPSCKVFIANPAAASEGISLHLDMDGNKICSNAIYLDRNFNASQFIQSVDRIHRIGIRETPHVYVLITKDSMDERVQSRLDLKINAMIELLNDTSLKPYTSADSSLESENFMFDESSDISITEDDKKYLIDEFYSK